VTASAVPRGRDALIARLAAPFRALDAEAEAERARATAPDRGPAVACVVGALALVFMEYVSERSVTAGVYALFPALYRPRFAALAELAAWIFLRLIGFVVIPALAIRFILRRRVRDFGLGPAMLPGTGVGYLALFALVVPCVLLAASRPEFTSYYPFYRFAYASWAELAVWELLYASHFVALEFFFRGFWLTACRQSFGSAAVFVSAVPYCMIHFTKPLLEVVAALPAGIVLGLFSMRARAIWGGAALHVAVAWLMDALALAQTTGFPARLFPNER
jgi:uncharacterized protein